MSKAEVDMGLSVGGRLTGSLLVLGVVAGIIWYKVRR